MDRPKLEVADVFRRYGAAYRDRHGASLSTAQRRVMSAIEKCRTAALGGHLERCDECGHERNCYNSCGDRHCPKCQSLARARWIEDRQAELLEVLVTNGRRIDGQEPLLQNGRGMRLGRHGARYILLKYLRQAASSMPSLGRPAISPHTLRHTKGMHLLQSGVPLVMVKDFLGHVDMKSTDVYVQADLDMKRNALESATGPQPTQPADALPSGLIEWLESL